LEVFGNEQKNKSGKTMPVKDTIQSRRGSSAQWSAANPILADGEIGYDSTAKQMKIGDGVTAWNSLTYLGTSSTSFLAYLQSLPTTEPLTPNMPWWNSNVLNRSAVAVGFTFRRPGGVDSYIRPSSGTYLRA
jgi:hypothetical protein